MVPLSQLAHIAGSGAVRSARALDAAASVLEMREGREDTVADSRRATVAEPLQFRAPLYLVGAALLLMAAFQITRGAPFNVVVGALLVIAAVGLLRKLHWGRRMSVFFMWLLVAVAIGNVLPARIEADEALGMEPATSSQLVTQLVLLCSVAIGSLHFLGKDKARFRSGWW